MLLHFFFFFLCLDRNKREHEIVFFLFHRLVFSVYSIDAIVYFAIQCNVIYLDSFGIQESTETPPRNSACWLKVSSTRYCYLGE